MDETTLRRNDSRRSVLKRIGGLGVAGVVAGSGIVLMSRPGFAIEANSFSANPVSITSNAGNVKDVYVKPGNLAYTWNGLETDPKSLTFEVRVDKKGQNGSGTDFGNMSVLGSETDPNITSNNTEGLEGSGSYSFDNQLSLIDDGDWKKSDFNASGDGTQNVVSDIEIKVRGTLETEGGNTYTNTRGTTFDVTVTNQKAGTGGSGGDAGTGGDAPPGNNK